MLGEFVAACDRSNAGRERAAIKESRSTGELLASTFHLLLRGEDRGEGGLLFHWKPVSGLCARRRPGGFANDQILRNQNRLRFQARIFSPFKNEIERVRRHPVRRKSDCR